MNKKLIVAAAAALPAAGLAAADIVAGKIAKDSLYIKDKDRNSCGPDVDRTHESNPDIKTVWMESFDGCRLMGHWYPCGDALRTVICMHGWHGSWLKDFGEIISFLHNERCNVLLPDERGQNGSEGKMMGFALLERYDALEWIRWVNRETGSGLPVYLYGVSMGSAAVMMASALDLPGNTAGIIADCGYTSPQGIWSYLFKKTMHLPYGRLMASLLEFNFSRRSGIKGTSYSASDALRKCRVPVLFVHGSADDFVPPYMSYENYEACASDKELLIIEGAPHAKNYATDPAPYEAAVRRLFAKCE